MPLVDYASSGEETEDEPEVQQEKEVIERKKKLQPIIETVPIKNNKDEDDNNPLFQKLPKPRKEYAFLGDDSSLSKLLLNTNSLPLGKKTDKKSIKIAAPSISEFDDGEQPRKKLKPSVKGVGLFSILPPPKNNTIKESNRTLIPQILAKSQRKKNEILKRKTNVTTGVDPDDDDIQIGTSFFGSSLTESHNKVEPELSESISNVHVENNLVENMQVSSQGNFAVDQSPTELNSNVSVTYVPDNASNSDMRIQTPEASVEESLDLDETALQILCGNKKKRQQMPVNIIDLSGKEIMPDSKEWLLKQFTEEKTGRGLGHKKSHGFSSQSRRKHQITYLAYQAKEQELELQNMWAQNRMSRKQTQQKYGF